MKPGTRLSHFVVLAPLGSGAMGEVYRARDEKLDREVAIKVLPKEVAGDAARLDRFHREARALAKLSHPNVLPIFEFGEDREIHFVVTELLLGETLRDRLERGPLPWRETVDLAAAVADGLAAAHAQSIVHRDIKPANVFLPEGGPVKLLDFGLAKIEAPVDLGSDAATTASLSTSPGTVLGTLGYMAPEQVRGEPADHRCDIFALGCVLYEMLSGRRAFHRSSAAETMSAVLNDDPPRLRTLDLGVPGELDRIVARCIAKRRAERFQSAVDLAFALRETGSGDAFQHLSLPRPGDARRSIAVLPFSDLSDDQGQEYFCDGVAEEIINSLAQVTSMRVVARTSAFAFKGQSVDIREIGARLDVDTVLEGSVRKSGDRLRITAQLIDVRDGCHLWSHRFDRRLEDIFAIQDEIALAIVDHLKVNLLAREKVSLVRRHTENIEAHNAYLVALFEWNKMSPEGFERCQRLLREAIALDPDFAPAYAQLADSFTSATWWTDQPPNDALEHTLPLVEKALQLDPDLPHAHSVMGNCQAFYLRNWAVGEASLRRASELAPNDAFAQSYLASALLMARPGEECAARALLAIRLDPLSPSIGSWASVALTFSGHQKEGLAVIEEHVSRNPHLWMPRYFQSVALASQQRIDEATAAAERAADLSGGSSLTLSHLACLEYIRSDRTAGDALLLELQGRARRGYLPPMFLVFVSLARGDPDTALGHAVDAGAARDPWIGPYRLYCPAIFPSAPRVDEVMRGYLP